MPVKPYYYNRRPACCGRYAAESSDLSLELHFSPALEPHFLNHNIYHQMFNHNWV